MNKNYSLPLENRTVLITGSSRGIGAATARLAKEHGADVILHGKTDSESLQNLSRELDSRYIFCDVSNELRVQEEVRKIGSIDVLVNNAGINPSKTFMELTSQDWRDILEVNVLGTVNFSKTVIPRMLEKQYGKIINVASVKGYSHVSGKPAYASSKAAVIRMTSSMAEEFAPYILVNAVAPGFTETEMTERTISPKIQNQINRIPLKRMAEPREIAEAILFLASDKANYITGQTICVDGGFSISNG
ncbi:MAG: glucose 1-dehydrogenase [Nanoarchaeota archaeon]|nr:glucose 1-dehydrogenase [Nanoarchaeota archaeon]